MKALKKFCEEYGHGGASLIAEMMERSPSTVTRWRDGVWIPIPETRKKILHFIAVAKKSFKRSS